MDAFSRSLAAAALVDGQHFTLPGFGTIEGVYISARIDHGARRVEAPRLEVRWQSEEDETAQTFSEFLIGTGATTFEAEDIENSWLDALSTGESIHIGDLGALIPNKDAGTCTFEPDTAALATAFSGSQTVALEPMSKRALPETPVAPVIAIETKSQATASAKTKTSVLRNLVPIAAAAAIVFLGVMSIQYFTTGKSTLDSNQGKALNVNQDRLNRSPREVATTADLPIEIFEEASPADRITGQATSAPEFDNSIAEDFSEAIPEDEIADVIPTGVEAEEANKGNSTSSRVSSSKDIPSFDPAALAGGPGDDSMFSLSEIDVVIVLGSFSSAANAGRLTEQVAAAGLIPYVDQPGELTRVGATFSVSSEAEIEELKHQMRKQFNPTAWVLE